MLDKYIRKWEKGYGSDELESICNYYIWRAYDTYDISKGISFAYYARIVLDRSVLYELNKLRKHEGQISLNQLYRSEQTNGETAEIIEIITYDKDQYEDSVTRIAIEQELDRMPELDRRIFNEYYNGEYRTQAMIAKEVHMAQSNVNNIIKKVKKKLKEEL